ncbi:MAG TPA: RidA family protein [Cytophagaceae bacterium]|jgi:2-iminobutanoate/2-iminopropanoate deaminase|nr:RidA family protein [Cytophagaceae bacterium]
MKKIITSKHAPAPIGPYNQAILAGNTLYLSGQIALDPISGNMVNQDIVAETHQVMKNLKAVLEEGGADFSKVVKCSIFVKNMNDFATINKIYGEYFVSEAPARETVEVARLPKDAHVEISCIAVL